MKLTFKDRLTILYSGLLPFSADINGIKLNKSIKGKVDFSKDEKTRLDLQNVGSGSFNYKTEEPLTAFSKDAEFTTEEMAHISSNAKRMNTIQAITEDSVDTIEKFMPKV